MTKVLIVMDNGGTYEMTSVQEDLINELQIYLSKGGIAQFHFNNNKKAIINFSKIAIIEIMEE